jgi:hypothetical protein
MPVELTQNKELWDGLNFRVGLKFVGVPKHSELEPDYCLAKGNGEPPPNCGQNA